MRVGYGKLGRSISFKEEKYGFQGDAEAPNLLFRLAKRNPQVEWVLIGRNDATAPFMDYPNITNPWLKDGHKRTGGANGFATKLSVMIGTLDALVIQVGQHGTSHRAIPQSNSTWAQFYEDPETHSTTPYDWANTYADFMIQGMNLLGDRSGGSIPVVYVVPDPRNYIFARDIKWPTGLDDILSQYQMTRTQRHERFQDARTPEELGFADVVDHTDREGEIWVCTHTHRYADLELMILPDDWTSWGGRPYHERAPIGVASTSFAVTPPPGMGRTTKRRSEMIKQYVLDTWPDAEVFGKWDEGSLKDVPPGTVVQNDPTEFPDLLSRWKCTVALPALGTAWTAAKPYQCFAANTICFHVGPLDDQGWVIPSRIQGPDTHRVGEGVTNVPLYSVRDDWTDDELRLAAWLRTETPDDLRDRVKVIDGNPDVWKWLATTQRTLLWRRWNAHLLESEIERKIGLDERL